jgi:hypothetical protein
MAKPVHLLLYAALAVAAAAVPARAQPEPSFDADCGELRTAIETLGDIGDRLVTIRVKGTLRGVQSDAALAYLLLCAAPDPQVLCVTYSTGGRKAGEQVTVTGTFSPRGPNHVLLDPCLPEPKDE